MKMKRGTDHYWEVRKYKDDLALYAHCNCGFEYVCSKTKYAEDKGFSTEISFLYRYCPKCGAKKKWYNDVPKKCSWRYSE